jgi:hypothetical protein
MQSFGSSTSTWTSWQWDARKADLKQISAAAFLASEGCQHGDFRAVTSWAATRSDFLGSFHPPSERVRSRAA